MNVPDPYKILQVDPEAEDEVIEAAYRRLARKYHPDVSPDPESVARMVLINKAWELLQDPFRRAAVDRARARAAGSETPRAAGAASTAPPDPVGHEPQRPSGRESTGVGADPIEGATSDWPFPGMRDPSSEPGPRPQRVSRDWTSGRSTTGGGYDPTTMETPQGTGSSGPPPGNPSGTVLNFGRYANWSLGEIARVDLEYLEWLDRMPIGRAYHDEIDKLLRGSQRRKGAAPPETSTKRGLFRRR